MARRTSGAKNIAIFAGKTVLTVVILIIFTWILMRYYRKKETVGQ